MSKSKRLGEREAFWQSAMEEHRKSGLSFTSSVCRRACQQCHSMGGSESSADALRKRQAEAPRGEGDSGGDRQFDCQVASRRGAGRGAVGTGHAKRLHASVPADSGAASAERRAGRSRTVERSLSYYERFPENNTIVSFASDVRSISCWLPYGSSSSGL